MSTITTITSGTDYRVTHDGASLRFVLDSDSAMVCIYTTTANLGGWRLDRFGGSLSPESIRAFLKG